MALHQVHEEEASRSELQRALSAGLDRARPGPGEHHWRDWEFGHILLQEAPAGLSANPGAPKSTTR